MSGTSLDGIDIIYASYLQNNNWSYKIHNCETIKYPKKWKLILSDLVSKSNDELKAIDKEYTKYLGTVILDFINRLNITVFQDNLIFGTIILYWLNNSLGQHCFSNFYKSSNICPF